METQENKKPIVSSNYPTRLGTHTIDFPPAKVQQNQKRYHKL